MRKSVKKEESHLGENSVITGGAAGAGAGALMHKQLNKMSKRELAHAAENKRLAM